MGAPGGGAPTSGGGLMQRPPQQSYSPVRGGPMTNQSGGTKRGQESRSQSQQQKK